MKKKTVIGAAVMALVILASIPLGTNRSFARLRRNVQDEYWYDNTGYSIYQGIEIRVDAARNLVTVAKRYVKQEPGLDPYIDEVERRAKQCENSWFKDVKDVDKLVSGNQLLQSAAEDLAAQLETVDLSQRDAKYPRQLMAEMDSEQDKIERSSFNDEVIAYNQKLTGFPARVLAPLVGVRQISPFGPGSGSHVDMVVVQTPAE